MNPLVVLTYHALIALECAWTEILEEETKTQSLLMWYAPTANRDSGDNELLLQVGNTQALRSQQKTLKTSSAHAKP